MLVTASVGPVKKTLGKKGIQDAVRAYESGALFTSISD